MHARARDVITTLFLAGWGVAIALHRGAAEPWPFTTFPMFRVAREPHARITRLELVGTSASGQEVRSLNLPAWRRPLLDALDHRPAMREELLRVAGQAINADRPEDPLVDLRLVQLDVEVVPAFKAWPERVLAQVAL